MPMSSPFTSIKNNIVTWVRDHDERWSFIAVYILGAIALSVFMNLFWVMMLAACHALLKTTRNVIVGQPSPLLSALWQIKLDIALLLFAIVIAVYSQHLFAALGLGQAARGAAIATRFGIIERGLKVFLMTIDDQARLVGAAIRLARRRTNKEKEDGVIPDMAVVVAESGIDPEPYTHVLPWTSIGKGDYFAIIFGILCVTLLATAPALIDITAAETWQTILREISPSKSI